MHQRKAKVFCFFSSEKKTFLAFLAALAAVPAAAATPCTTLSGTFPQGGTLKVSQALGYTGQSADPYVLSIAAQDVAENALEDGVRTPAVCSVKLVVSSNGNPSQSQIAIGVLLPEGAVGTASPSAWNGRFLGTGNGGFGGTVATGNMITPLSGSYVATGKTFALANTDLGTGILFHCTSLFCGSAQGVALYPNQTPGGLHGDAAAISDFGSGATHLMTLAGRALIGIFYGAAPRFSYFHGCSTGGRQALSEAQRFPGDYDGILAGSPAYDLTHLHDNAATLYEASHFGPADHYGLPDSLLTAGAVTLGHAAMLAQCAGKDGGLPADDYLTRPSICKFNAATLQCHGQSSDVPCTDPAGTTCTCLTQDQTFTLNHVWDGATDSDGRILYPGYERSAEADLNTLGGSGKSALTEPLYDSTDYWVYGPHFDWTSLFQTTHALVGELAGQIRAIDTAPVGNSTFADILNANSAGLRAFHAHGGKLILYAGYADPRIPSASTIDYTNQVLRDDPATPDFATLYLAPGMWHCNGGPGANVFGNVSPNLPPAPASPSDDLLAALLQWRETGQPPGPIVATKYTNDDPAQGIAFQRPLCRYPDNAAYNTCKTNNPALATSYICRHDPPVTNQAFSPVYGPR